MLGDAPRIVRVKATSVEAPTVHAQHLYFLGLKLRLRIAHEAGIGLLVRNFLERAVALQAAPYVAALAACYAEAQEPPVQFFNAIFQVISPIAEVCANTLI